MSAKCQRKEPRTVSLAGTRGPSRSRPGSSAGEVEAAQRVITRAGHRGAWRRLDEARRHLDSSVTLASTDPSLAYVALYDAARKALVGHMEANGYRPTNRLGAHQAVGMYGEATVATSEARSHVLAFDRLRQVRNRSEYGNQIIG